MAVAVSRANRESGNRSATYSRPSLSAQLRQIGYEAGAVLICAVLAACGSTARPAPAERTPPQPSGPDPATNPVAFVRQFSTPEQAAALADGVVTASEYERSVLATAQCMTEQGIQFVDPPHWDKATNTRLQFSYVAGDTVDKSRTTNDTYDRCRNRFSTAVEQLWQLQDAPSERKLQQARAALGDCLRDQGVQVPEGATSEDLAIFSAQEAFLACARKVEAEFQIPGFVG